MAELAHRPSRQPTRSTPPAGSSSGPLGARSAVAQLHEMAARLNQRSAPAPIQAKATPRDGLPANLKTGMEALSGIALDDVRVHRNSSEPAQLGAHAYAQGSDIHLAPGQERHLPHEAWHVVQQKQGRVKATRQMEAGLAINEDRVLEAEADAMGARSAHGPASVRAAPERFSTSSATPARAPAQLARIPVGFNRVAAAGAGDSLVTAGLGNCIAVAAQDPNTGRAVMGHFDTINAWNNVAMLTGFRQLLINELEHVAAAPINPVFSISIGAIWLNLAPLEEDENQPGDSVGVRQQKANRRAQRLNMANMRHTLLVNCVAVFGVEPGEAGGVAEFDLATRQITGSAALGSEANLVPPPQNDPHGTAGDEITNETYARLQRGNERGHKLDKNMSIGDKLSVRVNPD